MAKLTNDETQLEKKLNDLHLERERVAELPTTPEKRIAEIRALIGEVKADFGSWLGSMDRTIELVGKTVAGIPGPAALAIFLDKDAETKLIAAVQANWPKNAISDAERVKRLKQIDAETVELSQNLCEVYHAQMDDGRPISPSPHVRPQDFLGVES